MNIINIVICLWLNTKRICESFFLSFYQLHLLVLSSCFVSSCALFFLTVLLIGPGKLGRCFPLEKIHLWFCQVSGEGRGQGTPATWNYLKANFSYIYIYPLIYLFLKYFIPWSILQPKDSLFSLLPKRQNTSYIYGSLPMRFFIQPFFFHSFESNYARRVSSTSCTSSFHNNCCKQGI